MIILMNILLFYTVVNNFNSNDYKVYLCIYANQNIELYILPKLGGDATKPPPVDKH